MRVTLVGTGMLPIPPTGYGAVEKHIWHLAGALEELGHETRIVHQARGQASRHEYSFALWARKKARARPYDVLHLHTPGVAAVFGLLGPKHFVYTTHSRHWMTAQRAGERFGLGLERRAVGRADATIAVSDHVGKAIGQNDRVVVVPNGVDTNLYQPRPQARTGKTVVGVGLIAPHKGWHVAAQAMRGLDAKLVLVGPLRDPAYAKRIQDVAPGQVELVGEAPEERMVEILGSADVLVHPSVSESFGMAAVEGMAAGLPVVGSDILAGVVSDGEDGILVPTWANDEERARQVRAALERLLRDAPWRRALGENARRHAVERFDWLAVARRVADVYAGAAR